MNRSLKLGLIFAGIAVALSAFESRSCLAQNTKPNPSIEAIDGNAIDSIELVQGDSKKLNYGSPISKANISETFPSASKAISIEFVSKDSFVVTGQKPGVAIVTLHTPDQVTKKLTINVMPDMTRRRRKTLAVNKEQRSQKITGLINSLADLDSVTIGIHPQNSFSFDFIPNLSNASDNDTDDKEMQQTENITKLLEMGEEAIPQLLERLSDHTPTKLSIDPQEYDLVVWHSDEYYPVHPPFSDSPNKQEDFEGDYQVKIGDVCFALIGQIVNRPYLAVRNQPMGGMVVNSPVHTPELKQRAVSEWQNLDDTKLKASLLNDLKSDAWYIRKGAKVRLDYYFPPQNDPSKNAKNQ